MKKLFFILIIAVYSYATGFPSEYYKLKGDEKKEYFFEHLSKIIDDENKKIIRERNVVKSVIKGILGLNPHSVEFKEMLKIKKKYRIRTLYAYKEYLKRVDIIPASQALAQAAVESAWGTSRFVKLANNIFGHWTYTEPGIIPAGRDENATHMIKIYSSLNTSVAGFMLNLNRNRAYEDFRKVRAKMRKQNKKIEGKELSQTMINYSGIGERYLEILESMIEKYDLHRFDKRYSK